LEIKDIISSGLLELYITGLTSEEETVQVEQLAKQYPEVMQEINDLQKVMETYAMAEAVQPDKELKEKIIAKIKPDISVKDKIFSRLQTPIEEPFTEVKVGDAVQQARVFSIPGYYKWAIAASIILLMGSLIFNYTYYNKYKSVDNRLAIAEQDLQKQQQVATAMENDINVVTDKNALPVVLNGTENNPDALAKIFWMKNTGEVYVDSRNLPETPSGKQYQLWAIVDGAPVDAGMITTSKGTYRIQKMKSFGKADAFAITLEKTGGSAAPTMSAMVVQAKI
jgi:archaellum component FlaG (FlaF/FlaG flagellin family)